MGTLIYVEQLLGEDPPGEDRSGCTVAGCVRESLVRWNRGLCKMGGGDGNVTPSQVAFSEARPHVSHSPGSTVTPFLSPAPG